MLEKTNEDQTVCQNGLYVINSNIHLSRKSSWSLLYKLKIINAYFYKKNAEIIMKMDVAFD